MTKVNHPDTTLTLRASTMLRSCIALKHYRLLFVGYPPAKGAVSRVTACVGEEIHMPGTGLPLLIHALNESRTILAGAERDPGTNTLDYLAMAAKAILLPVRLADGLHVRVDGGAAWTPNAYDDWDTWREAHPGTLVVTESKAQGAAAQHRALEQRLLGRLFVHKLNQQCEQEPLEA